MALLTSWRRQLPVRRPVSSQSGHGETGEAPQRGRRGTAGHAGLEFPRFFSTAGIDPFDQVEWELRDAVIGSEKGQVVFEQRQVEMPRTWSQQATNIVVSKYFRGHIGSPDRERSVKQLIGRVVDTITEWARKQKYFASDEALSAFSDDLKHLLVEQKAAFNSPVWFNCGFEKAPQCSACFINSVDDTMESILTLAKTEGMLFKYGSGTGSNLSAIRSSKELLAGGGTASGPGVVHEGLRCVRRRDQVGRQDAPRREDGHPQRRAPRHRRVHQLQGRRREEGLGADRRRLRRLVHRDGLRIGVLPELEQLRARRPTSSCGRCWTTACGRRARVVNGEVMDTYRARDLMRLIAEGTWVCGDPGMQFDTTVNEWHTSPNTARINASNPCSEYMFLDDSACNLASLNLMKFVREDGEFDTEAFKAAVPHADHRAGDPRRQLELSDQGDREEQPRLPAARSRLRQPRRAADVARPAVRQRSAAATTPAAITALMTGEAYAQSARVARDHGGPFAGYEANREPFLRVMRKHRDAMKDVNGAATCPRICINAAKQSWDDAVELGEDFGYRNAQATVLAPTGTIGFMMDCDTTGVEPDIALVKYKKLVGGGMMKIVNMTVPMALKKLGYTAAQVTDIIAHIDTQETIEGAPHLLERDLPVFDCAFKAANGERSIHYMGHIKMMGATQPFISGAISKTVNVPKEATVEEIEQAYLESWRLGAKAISIYRDGSKRTQPLNTSRDARRQRAKRASDTKAAIDAAVAAAVASRTPVRRKLPDERHALTHKFDIAGHEGYVTVGLFEDGQPGEIFLVMAKEGSTISGFADAFAQAISYALQYGVPLQALVDKFSHVRFEPSGMTKNPDVRFAKSIVDYIFRWMASKFLSPEAQYVAGVNNRDDVAEPRMGGNGHAELSKVVVPPPAPAKAAQRREAVVVCGDPEPGRRAAVLDLRLDHGAQRRLLQVQQLRHDVRLRLAQVRRLG